MNKVEFNNTLDGITVILNHKVYFSPKNITDIYDIDFLKTLNEEELINLGFEFAYGLNAY